MGVFLFLRTGDWLSFLSISPPCLTHERDWPSTCNVFAIFKSVTVFLDLTVLTLKKALCCNSFSVFRNELGWIIWIMVFNLGHIPALSAPFSSRTEPPRAPEGTQKQQLYFTMFKVGWNAPCVPQTPGFARHISISFYLHPFIPLSFLLFFLKERMND